MLRIAHILPTLALVAHAAAQSVDFRITDREGWVGTPLVMEIEVTNAADTVAPTIAANADFDVRVNPSPRRMEWRQNINGRSSNRSTLTWSVEFIPKHEGSLQIPIAELTTGGRAWRSTPVQVKITNSLSNETLKLELRSQPPLPWVGQSVQLTLRIMVRPFTSAQHGVSLDEAQMWQLMDDQNVSWGLLEPRIRELSQSRQRPAGAEEVMNGTKWLIYEITAPFTPTEPGPIDLGDLRVGWRYPTGVTAGRDFFGTTELSLSGVRQISATLPTTRLIAKALPEVGRPASFHGAVGNFEMHATAKPTEVAVGDPITLSVSVVDQTRGGNELKTLQPPLIDQASLGGGFRVPSDPLAGTVDGSIKTFTQTLRPTSTDLKQIPSIEFSYFDPQRGQYASARTQPITIRVSPAERLTNDRIERNSATQTGSKPAGTSLTEVEGGLLANADATADLLQDQRMQLGMGVAALFVIPPALALCVLAVRRRNDRMRGDAGLLRVQSATRNARAIIATAADAAIVAEALCNFIADRSSHAVGTITRSQAVDLSAEAGADEQTQKDFNQLLAAGERAAFAPDRGGDASEARSSAESLLQKLDRLRFTRHKADLLQETQI